MGGVGLDAAEQAVDDLRRGHEPPTDEESSHVAYQKRRRFGIRSHPHLYAVPLDDERQKLGKLPSRTGRPDAGEVFEGPDSPGRTQIEGGRPVAAVILQWMGGPEPEGIKALRGIGDNLLDGRLGLGLIPGRLD